jgi:O-antigen/teichoic acid export membrane protein
MRAPAESLRALASKRLPPIVLTQAAGFACGVAGITITSRLVAPGTYGAYGVFLTLAPLGLSVVHAGLVKFVARHWAASDDRAGLLGEVRRAAVRKLPLLAIATFAAVWLVPGLGPDAGATNAGATSQWWSTWLLLFAGASLVSAAWIGQTALQAGRRHWRDCGVAAAGSVTRSFVPPLLYAVAGGTLLALQAGFVVHALAVALASVWALRNQSRQSRPRNDFPAGKQLTPIYDGPLFVMLAVAAWTLTGVNRWIVAGFFGAETAGYFTLAGNVAVIVTSMLGVVFTQYWQPVVFAMPSDTSAARRALARSVDLVALCHALCGFAMIGFLHVVTPWLVGIVIDAKYAGATGLVAPAGCFGIAVVTGQFFHMLLLAAHKERACATADLGGAAVLVAGGVLAAIAGGETWFWRWLLVSPIVPWLLNRTLARRALFS